MFSKKVIKLTAQILLVAFLASCSTTYEVTKRNELKYPGELGKITVTTGSGDKYLLNGYNLGDNTISGYGTRLRPDSIKTFFRGSLKLKDINRIEAKQSNVAEIAISIGIGAIVVGTFIAFLNKETSLNNDVRIVYPGGGGCKLAGIIENTPQAGGLGSLYYAYMFNFDNSEYLNLTGTSDTLHFEITRSTDEVHLEMIKEIPVNTEMSDVLTIKYH